MKTRVYKKYGWWWVLWENRRGFNSITCFDTNYHEAQHFTNTVGKAQTWN